MSETSRKSMEYMHKNTPDYNAYNFGMLFSMIHIFENSGVQSL